MSLEAENQNSRHFSSIRDRVSGIAEKMRKNYYSESVEEFEKREKIDLFLIAAFLIPSIGQLVSQPDSSSLLPFASIYVFSFISMGAWTRSYDQKNDAKKKNEQQIIDATNFINLNIDNNIRNTDERKALIGILSLIRDTSKRWAISPNNLLEHLNTYGNSSVTEDTPLIWSTDKMEEETVDRISGAQQEFFLKLESKFDVTDLDEDQYGVISMILETTTNFDVSSSLNNIIPHVLTSLKQFDIAGAEKRLSESKDDKKVYIETHTSYETIESHE